MLLFAASTSSFSENVSPSPCGRARNDKGESIDLHFASESIVPECLNKPSADGDVAISDLVDS